jgi:hypothetical protein
MEQERLEAAVLTIAETLASLCGKTEHRVMQMKMLGVVNEFKTEKVVAEELPPVAAAVGDEADV